MPSINPDTPLSISISQENYFEIKSILITYYLDIPETSPQERLVILNFLELMSLSWDRDIMSPYFIALQAEATKDEDDEPVEMLPTTRELKEMSSQVEAN